MEMIRAFATPIWIEDLELDVDNIVSTVKDIQHVCQGNIFSNIGGWQSKDLVSGTISKYKHLYKLVNILQKSIDIISTEIDPTMKLSIGNVWINVNKLGDYNIPHYHPGSAFSGVLYIQCSTGSNIQFKHDTLMEHYPFKTKSELFADTLELFPKVGRLIVFPAWIKHSVSPNQSDTERISIAFNMKQEKN
jgi:uncharacterized protein (TIGR02466 family)